MKYIQIGLGVSVASSHWHMYRADSLIDCSRTGMRAELSKVVVAFRHREGSMSMSAHVAGINHPDRR